MRFEKTVDGFEDDCMFLSALLKFGFDLDFEYNSNSSIETACHMLLNKFGNTSRILAYAFFIKKRIPMIVLLIDCIYFLQDLNILSIGNTLSGMKTNTFCNLIL